VTPVRIRYWFSRFIFERNVSGVGSQLALCRMRPSTNLARAREFANPLPQLTFAEL